MSSFSLADLSLFLATPEQTYESRKWTAVQWAKGLSLAHYIQRDVIMESLEHATDNKLTTWVLAPRNDPTTLDFMCSCETFRREALIARSSAVTEASAYGIASVFTPEEKRRRGYAQHMMRLLHWILAPRSSMPDKFPAAWGGPPKAFVHTGDARFSVIYSDVGSEFYRACGPSPSLREGWLERGSIQTALDTSTAPATYAEDQVAEKSWHLLSENDVNAVFSREASWVRADLAHAATSTPRTLFSFLPDDGVGASLIKRTMNFTSEGQPTWGAAVAEAINGAQPDEVTYATWTLDILSDSRSLVVTRLRTTTDTFKGLLDQLIKFARQQNISAIDIWGLPENLQHLAGEFGWTTSHRSEHLSAFKWYGSENAGEVDWLFNEKYVVQFRKSP
ncbi:hypothetical protein WOLCODRAFT_133434 [Wolfiporia cocos MD-104 SS10]|uniref:LYC1 C-terminal domain-containing protein n=1 Tax=Wolfiporia cocos (strain MD-104) TaxID=742152 RepID=A0A2H3K774_WOLCO|nr:hypothetical protein WOLCODRAFT_133434 [Wolfiporia cocos MD-104 SS10]